MCWLLISLLSVPLECKLHEGRDLTPCPQLFFQCLKVGDSGRHRTGVPGVLVKESGKS